MSKLEKLISELCPNGVELKKLGEIALDIYRGSGITRDQVTTAGIPCVRYGEIYTTYDICFDKCASYTDEEIIKNKKYFEYGDILFAITGESVEDIAKSCVYVGNEKCLAGGDIVVLKHKQDPKYLSYALSTTDAQKQKSKGKIKSKVVHSSVPAIKEIIIPIPSLPIQHEIVSILDKFKELTEKLIIELTAELTARKKQYEYYRSHLFEFNNEQVEWKTLGDVYDFQYGEGNTIPNTGGFYPVFGSNGIVGKHNKYNSEDAPVIGHIGAYAGIVNWGQGKHFVTYNGVICKIKGNINPKFGYYFLLLQDFRSKAKSGSQPFISYDILKKVEIPIPNIAMQEHIVEILDRFDTLVNEITQGLTTEIEARQKQYEYYRDKLLTFKELKND